MAGDIGLVFAPDAAIVTLGFILCGVALGTVSGLVPGLHANNMALLLAAAAPAIPGPPAQVGAAILAAGVIHTFLDIVPSLAIGVPDPAMAASALPGHRLVLEGRGREALRLSAAGSGLAVLLALPLAVPITAGMRRFVPVVIAHLPIVLGAAAVVLVLTEPTPARALAGLASFLIAAGLGVLTLDLEPVAPLATGGMLAPLFAGLFGAPVLIESLDGRGVPQQADPHVALSRQGVLGLGLLGTIAGAVVGYVPGVSSAIAATLALVAVPGRFGARGFVVATSGVNTANTIFALFALIALGSPRTGVLVAFEATGAPLQLPRLLIAVLLAAAIGFTGVLVVGDRYLVMVGRLDTRRLGVSLLGLLAILSGLFAGMVGLITFGVAGLIGLIPARCGARRAHLMGVLMGPLALGS